MEKQCYEIGFQTAAKRQIVHVKKATRKKPDEIDEEILKRFELAMELHEEMIRVVTKYFSKKQVESETKHVHDLLPDEVYSLPAGELNLIVDLHYTYAKYCYGKPMFKTE